MRKLCWKIYNIEKILLVTIIIMVITGSIFANHPISGLLEETLRSGDYNSGQKILSGYTLTELAALPDSVLFDYYYLKAFIRDKEGNEKDKIAYLNAAKDLCEKSQGIHSPVYLELCWALGNSLADAGDKVAAFEIFQQAIIQSIGLYSLDDEDVKWQFEEINNRLIEWYKDKNLRQKMITHRKDLPLRDMSKDAVQEDMDFYLQYYKDKNAKALLRKAANLSSMSAWRMSADIYSQLADTTQDNPIAKATLNEMAAANYINSDDYSKAEDLLLSNLKLLERYQKSKVYRRTLSQLSNLYNSIRNYTKAKRYAELAKFWYEEMLDFSRGYIICLHRCAALERGNENYFLALLLEDVALQELYKNNVLGIISDSDKEKMRFKCNLLSSAALHYSRLGFIEDAYGFLEEAIESAEANNLEVSPYYSNLANIALSQRDYQRAFEIQSKAYGLSKNDNEKIEIGSALCLSAFLADKPLLQEALVESSQSLHNFLSNTFSFTSANERKEFWKYFEYHFPLINFLIYQTGDKALYGEIYNNILTQKGLLLRTANSLRDRILNSGNQTDIENYNRMIRLRSQLCSSNIELHDSIYVMLDTIDKSLTRKYSVYDNFIRTINIDWREVQKNIKQDEIAIEFYNIPQVKWDKDEKKLDGKYRYCAITLRKDYASPHIIPLFTQDRLNGLEREDIYETDSIYNMIWMPLEEELEGVKNIYFTADRDFHKIGIEYAPISEKENIGDRYNIFRLSSTRVLAENKTKSKKESAVLYGGLKYDLDKAELIAESRSGDYHPTSTSRAFTAENIRYGVKYLPGTLKEVGEISQNFSSTPRVITDISGTEESFKSLAGSSIDIIHLATHGFFWSEDDAQKRDYVTFLNPSNRSSQSNEDKALMRSGLFFSGANIGLKGETLPDDVEDGVLTALELSNMNLGNVDMVVMSACESGLGETSGEGVFGLQRGFKLAGANTLLMSLWKVDDDATRQLMTEFYKNYLSGKSKQHSLQLAQQSLRNKAKYSDPEYWAAFILLDGLN